MSNKVIFNLDELFTAEYSGPMPGCSAAECGNYKNLSVEEGRACCAWYRDLIASWTEEKLKYPAK